MAVQRSSIVIAVLLAATSLITPARAAADIEVTMNQAKIVKLSRPADTIRIGAR